MSFLQSVHGKYRVVSTHYTDLFPKNFEKFRKKYLKMSKTSEGRDLYVQFTNFQDSTLQKNPWPSPDHQDPVGIYGYPLAYVCSHPADIWYGAQAKFLRVLQDVSKRKLYLPAITTESSALDVLTKMGFKVPEAQNLMQLAWKHYKSRIGTASTKYAKMMMTAIQLDLSEENPKQEGETRITHKVRSGQEQTDLFKKAGYDAVEDESRSNKQAIINDREPQQIIFLSRGAFRVVDVYRLKDKDKFLVTNDPDKVARKLSAQIALVLNDSLSSDKEERQNLGGWAYFWTKGGRRIEINFPRDQAYYVNKKMGEKKHKEDKLSTQHQTQIVIQSEKGKIERTFSSDTKFKDILYSVRQSWNSLVESPQDNTWKPQDKKGFHVQVEEGRQAFYKKKKEEGRQKKREDLESWSEQISSIAALVGKPWHPTEEREELLDAYEFSEHLLNIYLRSYGFRHKFPPTKEDLEALSESVHTIHKDITPEMNQIEKIMFAAWGELKTRTTSFYFIKRELEEQRAGVS